MDKVLILGLSNGIDTAPETFDGPVWTCNDGPTRRFARFGHPRVDMMFTVHNLNIMPVPEKQSAILCEAYNIPILSVKEYPWLRNSHRYPKEAVVQLTGQDLFSDVICYMIAYAIFLGAKNISLCGVHLHPSQRDGQESALVHLWLGYALGKGIHIDVIDRDNPGCAILKNGEYWTGPGPYGHWDENEMMLQEQDARKNPFDPLDAVNVQGVEL